MSYMRVPQVMHDEAVTDAVSVMNQMTLGLGWLNGSLTIRPQIGWHIGRWVISAFYIGQPPPSGCYRVCLFVYVLFVYVFVCSCPCCLFVCLLCVAPDQIHLDTQHSHHTSTLTWNIKLLC